MEEKLRNLKHKLEEFNRQIDEAPGWGAYAQELVDKQRLIIKQIAYYEKELQKSKKSNK